jgi:hypothetical protein
MAISRRRFMRAGAIAAIAAGVCLKPSLNTLAQDLIGQSSASSTDPLANYTQATFAQYVDSIFRLRGRVTVDVTLMKVQDTLPAKVSRAGGRESFALHFRGGDIALPQDTYQVEHAALGSFMLFLVPTGADENGAQGYVAIINRLSYSGKTAAPKLPTKSRGTKPTTGGPPAGQPETPPAQPETPQAPTPQKPKPSRTRKRQPEGFEPLIDY